MKDIIDILEEQVWLEELEEQGLLNTAGLAKLKLLNIIIENMGMMMGEAEANES